MKTKTLGPDEWDDEIKWNGPLKWFFFLQYWMLLHNRVDGISTCFLLEIPSK